MGNLLKAIDCRNNVTESQKLDEEASIKFDINHNKIVNTNYEKVIIILQNLEKQAEKIGDKKSSKDINFCMKTLQKSDFHIPLKQNANINDKIKMDILNVYSNLLKSLRLSGDAEAVEKKSIENSKENVALDNDNNLEEKNINLIENELPNLQIENIPLCNMKKIIEIFPTIKTPNFNIFSLDRLCGKASLFFVLTQGYTIFNLFELITESKFLNFCRELAEGYNRTVHYHHDLHGADVCQTTITILYLGKLKNKLNLMPIDLIATITAAAAHDFKHDGFNNNFHVNKGSPLALTYNDSTCLENMHVAETFKMLIKDENFFVEKFSKYEYRHFRYRMIDGILSTDMAKHKDLKDQMNDMMKKYDIKIGEGVSNIFDNDSLTKLKNQQLILSQIIHTSDLSNPAKSTEVYKRWTKAVYEEFFHQGDVEKSLNLPISPLCDRNNVKIPDAQIGFIKFVVAPQFDMMLNLIPEISFYKDNIMINLNLEIENSLKSEEQDKEKEKAKSESV